MKLLTYLLASFFAMFSFISPASADFIISRGWTTDGVHQVAYHTSAGGLAYVTEAELAEAGVSIYNLAQVSRYLGSDWMVSAGRNHNFEVGPDGIPGTGDDVKTSEGGNSW